MAIDHLKVMSLFSNIITAISLCRLKTLEQMVSQNEIDRRVLSHASDNVTGIYR